jgi:glucose-1-phosphate thymidylyltransferase
MKSDYSEIVGLIPAAGYANRISPLPCSKEIYPVGFYNIDKTKYDSPKVISAYLLERMKYGGADMSYMIIRKGKWDIPQYYGNGDHIRMPLSYIVVGPTKGASFTIDKAYPFVKNKKILFGFPDIYFEPEDAYLKLLHRLTETGSDVVLGLFHAENPKKVDMVDIDSEGNILEISIKPEVTELKYTWIIGVWNPVFTNFIHSFLKSYETKERMLKSKKQRASKKEMHIGQALQGAIDKGFKINSVLFENHSYLDIGTTDDLKKAILQFNRNQ